jgi:hypothetical protein
MDAFFRALPGVFEAIDASDEVRRAFVFAAWRRVAGAQLTERTAPLDLDEKRLVIAVADRTWQANLESLAGQLLFRLNATLGRPLVDFIEFRIDPSTVDAVLGGTPAAITTEDSTGLPTEISESAAAIKDEQLRKAVLGAAANCLSRTKD